jgi:transglutaminase-like putative cysteine protease
MPVFSVRHHTTYQFSDAVELGPHQLYLRPRADHALRVDAASLAITPAADLVWRSDAYGNSMAVATFSGLASQLDIVSELKLETFPRSEAQRRQLQVESPASLSVMEQQALAPYLFRQRDEEDAIVQWLAKTTSKAAKPIYERLLECAVRIRHEFDYRPRFEPGVQTPRETLAQHSGTCRDFAELMAACARAMGSPARFVTGYVYVPNAAPGGSSPHAWTECYLPGLGWIEIDATNGLIDNGDLIAVAVARTGSELPPVAGTFVAGAGVTSLLRVGVDVAKIGA